MKNIKQITAWILTIAFTVIGNKELVDSSVLKELGEYKELKLEDIFGY